MPLKKEDTGKPRKRDLSAEERPAIERSSIEKVTNGEIYIEKGVTKNMGDYNSARVTVGIKLSFGETNFEATKRAANKAVDDELKTQVDELMDSF